MSSNAPYNQNREVVVDRSDEYRTRDILTGLVTVGPKILLLLLLLLSGGTRQAFAALGSGAQSVAEAATETVLPTAEAAAPEAAAATPEEVAQAEAAPTETAVPTPEVPEPLPTVAAPSIEESGVIPPTDFFIDPAALAAGWVAEQVAGTPIDPNSPGGFAGLPPHLSAMFDTGETGEAAKEDASNAMGVSPNQPQLSVIPLAALTSMYEAAGLSSGPQVFESLKELLETRPDDVSEIPAPPIFGNAGQGYIASPSFIDFQGGSGVGYVAHIGQEAGPIANDNGFTYVFQGLTSDGAQYIVGVWPLAASFLPATAGDVAQETLDSIAADSSGYVSTMIDAINAAAESDFSPSLPALQSLLAGLVIGPQAATANEAATQTDIAAAPDLTNTVWQWTAFQDTAEVNDLTVENPENYTVTMLDNGTYLIQADCNTGSGRYEVEGSSIKFYPGPLTRAFCGEESLDTTFLGYLFNAVTFVYDEEGNLVLNLFADAGNMVFANGGMMETAVAEGESESFVPVDSAEAVASGLIGTTLNWSGSVGSDGSSITVDNPENYSLTLNPDGTYSLQADCNSGGGSYTIEDGQIIFGPAFTTLMACPEGSQADAFLALLSQPASYVIDETGTVLLSFGDGATNATFNIPQQPAEAEPLVGYYWSWLSYDAPEGEDDITVDNPLNYALVFRPDGTYFIKADCNVGSGSFAIEGDQIQINPGALTRALCPEDSLDGEFLALLPQVTNWAINDAGELVFTLENGGTMVFGNAGAADDVADVAEDAAAPQAVADESGLTGYVFTWVGSTNADGEAVTVDNPDNYSFVLNPDGTFNITADCNVGFGVYTLNDDGTVTLNVLGQTLAFCGEDSQADEFINTLLSITNFELGDDGSIAFTTADGASASFVNTGPVESEGTMATPDDIQSIIWQWATFVEPTGENGIVVETPENYQLILFPDGTYSIQADCNVVAGAYTFEAGLLTLLPGATTLAACGPDSLDTVYLGYLYQPLLAGILDGQLILDLPADAGTLAFNNAGAAEVAAGGEGAATGGETAVGSPVGATWSWVSFQDAKQSFNVTNPENYTLQFLEDGSLALRADCNTGGGSYTIDGSTVSISVGALTLAACPAGSLGDSFVAFLPQVAVWSISNDVLLLDLVADGGTMTFTLVP
jgi:heat shock protein HslJ